MHILGIKNQNRIKTILGMKKSLSLKYGLDFFFFFFVISLIKKKKLKLEKNTNCLWKNENEDKN